jgi:t-SNARE complex subunit (syntaxin)
LCTTLTRKFIDEMKSYQSAQQKYKTTIQDKAVRTITNVKKDATPEEIDMLMKSDVSSQELFRQTMLTGVAGEIKYVFFTECTW